jgi:hypothetical protein
LTVTVHEPLAGIVAPASDTVPPPFAAVTLPPAQLVAAAGVALFTRPAGYVSVKAAPAMAVAFAFESVKVSSELPLIPTAAGLKALVTAGRESTASVAEAPAALPALLVVTAPVALR